MHISPDRAWKTRVTSQEVEDLSLWLTFAIEASGSDAVPLLIDRGRVHSLTWILCTDVKPVCLRCAEADQSLPIEDGREDGDIIEVASYEITIIDRIDVTRFEDIPIAEVINGREDRSLKCAKKDRKSW